jgi:rSAM/selenodomain-associated transferase 2
LAAISFIIPVLNEEALVGDLLAFLRRRFPSAELVVVDGNSSDNTCEIARASCDQLLEVGRGRARQMNAGAATATGQYLFFLHADTRPGVSEAQLQAYLSGQPGWGFSRVRLDGEEFIYRVIEWTMNWRSRLTRVGTGDQMLFVRKDVWGHTGGFDNIPLMEDVEYCKRLRRLYAPCILKQAAQTSSRRWRQYGVARTVLHMWALRLGYFLGVPPQRLYQSYYGGA